jgi:hypothetical protein
MYNDTTTARLNRRAWHYYNAFSWLANLNTCKQTQKQTTQLNPNSDPNVYCPDRNGTSTRWANRSLCERAHLICTKTRLKHFINIMSSETPSASLWLCIPLSLFVPTSTLIKTFTIWLKTTFYTKTKDPYTEITRVPYQRWSTGEGSRIRSFAHLQRWRQASYEAMSGRAKPKNLLYSTLSAWSARLAGGKAASNWLSCGTASFHYCALAMGLIWIHTVQISETVTSE